MGKFGTITLSFTAMIIRQKINGKRRVQNCEAESMKQHRSGKAHGEVLMWPETKTVIPVVSSCPEDPLAAASTSPHCETAKATNNNVDMVRTACGKWQHKKKHKKLLVNSYQPNTNIHTFAKQINSWLKLWWGRRQRGKPDVCQHGSPFDEVAQKNVATYN